MTEKKCFAEETNGYDREQVDSYISELSETYQTACDEYRAVKEKYDGLLEDLHFISEKYRAAAASVTRPSRTVKRIRGKFAVISDILFYLAMLMLLITVLTSGGNSGSPKVIMGHSYFTVLSSSMQDEIPKGSFILVRRTNPRELRIGDNITFMRDRYTSVTHKITDIYEDYQKSSAIGFQTKGVNNIAPDKEIVYESNVVGKVIFVLPLAGAAISWLGAHLYIVLIIFGLFVILSFCLRGLFSKPERTDNPVEI